MRTYVKTIIQPQFFGDFHCIGGDCKDSCCQGWSINLKKTEYDNTKKAKKSKELQTIVDSCMQRTKKTANEAAYAVMKLDEAGRCRLMDENGLCRLQTECGHKLLSTTCKQYPRNSFSIGQNVDMNLLSSCEAVVRLLMNRSEGIGLVEVPAKAGLDMFTHAIGEEDIKEHPAIEYWWDIKTLGLGILQCGLPFEDRLILLGIAMKRLNEFEVAGECDKIPGFVDSMLHDEIDESVLNTLREIEANRSGNTALVMNFFKTSTIADKILRREFYDKVTEKYKQYTDIPLELVEENHAHLHKFLEGREYMLNNILVNFYLSAFIPFKLTKLSIWDNYVLYCIIYRFTMEILAGYLDDDSTDDDFIHAVVDISRTLMHNEGMSDVFLFHFNISKYNTLAHMALLVKN